MADESKARRSYLAFAAVFLILSLGAFANARMASRDHTVVYMPDKIGGVGDTWMWPGQAYFLSAFCAVAALWLIVRFFRSRTR
jgi:hypothetical protein